ncbi:hypothetical protein [Roseiterribacter gracilis]|uniref:Uncharacterized protein n=1 Tax=Roseiterribacter gracilis TaxID=2812848 RepID=A0A8S8XAI3_9PROT|nr:hypothetical protein TMPK1_27200 [Rhodospirillales bacterium TMPK1]
MSFRRDMIRFGVFFAALVVIYGGMTVAGYEDTNKFTYAMFGSLAVTFVVVELLIRPRGPK